MSKNCTQFQFLEKAVSDDKFRTFMQDVYWDVENSNLVSVDGKRLHIHHINTERFSITPPEKSTYVKFVDNMILPINKDGTFPNYLRVIPTEEGYTESYDLDLECNNKQLAYNIPRFYGNTGIRISLQYIKGLSCMDW